MRSAKTPSIGKFDYVTMRDIGSPYLIDFAGGLSFCGPHPCAPTKVDRFAERSKSRLPGLSKLNLSIVVHVVIKHAKVIGTSLTLFRLRHRHLLKIDREA